LRQAGSPASDNKRLCRVWTGAAPAANLQRNFSLGCDAVRGRGQASAAFPAYSLARVTGSLRRVRFWMAAAPAGTRCLRAVLPV